MLCWKHHHQVINERNGATKQDELHQFQCQMIVMEVCDTNIADLHEKLIVRLQFSASDLYKISSSYRIHQMNAQNRHQYQTTDQVGGDIMTRVAIPRSGSFLNTSGLARYKSRATRRAKYGGGGGSPLGFSELFNEFRLQENLHSLDEILNAIINSEGMSFNDLKPIYKEFLLKLAVTLTKDELYQRSKSIMRRQKKKLMRRKKKSAAYQVNIIHIC